MILDLEISDYYKFIEGGTKLINWMKIVQKDAIEVTEDFSNNGYATSPEAFLSDKLGYNDFGYEKSLVKLLDEYYYLKFNDNLQIPPKWIPQASDSINLTLSTSD